MRSLDAYQGVFPPIVTPMLADGTPDLESLARLVEHMLAAGVQGIWALGTTGEFAALDAAERAAVLARVVQTVAGRMPVVANVSDAATRLVIGHARAARAAGADAIAATPPYYFPNSTDELLAHYTAIRAAVDLPLFIYNIPPTVKVAVDRATAVALASAGTVVGWKDSSGDIENFRQTMHAMRERGLAFRGFLGSRRLADVVLPLGGHGIIPATANACPSLYVAAHRAAAAGDQTAAVRWQETILAWDTLPDRVAQAGSRNAATIAVFKEVLRQQGVLRSAALGAPLRSLTDDERAAVAAALPALPQPMASSA